MNKNSQSFWRTPNGIAATGLIAMLGLLLVIEHRQHIFDVLPFLLLGACLLMHVFMHGSHGHGSNQHKEGSESRSNDYQRGLDDGKKKALAKRESEQNDVG